MSMPRYRSLTVLVVMLLAAPVTAVAQPASFADVVRNLRNPDPRERMSALRYLRQAAHVDAAVPVAALVTDPIDEIQLEAIATELSFALIADVPARRRVGLIVEVRSQGAATQAFDRGPLAAWPRRADPAVVDALLAAVDDENPRVRVEALYTAGVVAGGPLAETSTGSLVRALDHYDPAIRVAAARVIGRLRVEAAGEALIAAVNDSQAQVRYASMLALGEIREVRAVEALTQQLTFYGKGDGAWAALQALAGIAHPSSVPLFLSRLEDRDPNLRVAAAEGLGRTGEASALASLQVGATTDNSRPVRVAMTFALVKLGQNYLTRLVDGLASDQTAAQTQQYLLELGTGLVPELTPLLREPDPAVRARLAAVVGALGGEAAVAALQPLTQDRDREVAEAATAAIERIGMGR